MKTIYSSKFYDFLYDAKADAITFAWKKETKSIDDNGFQEGLSNFAGYANELRPNGLVVDLRNFFGRPSKAVAADWRKEVAVPRYNKSGVKKFAYIRDPDQPGPPEQEPVQHPGETFKTAVFIDEKALKTWLKQS